MVPSWADQLLPQLLVEQFDTLPIQWRHIEHMHEGVWFWNWQNYSCENIDNFSLIGLLYMHRWCLHGPINFYHSFWWSNLILCLYNVDTLNICMKEFGSEKNNFWQNDSSKNLDNYSFIWLLYMHRWCLHGRINFYHSFWWSNLILCLYNADTLNICMKEFGSEKNNFWQNDSRKNLDNYSYICLLYMHRWYLHGPINSYHSFWWNYFILCLYNVDTLNICMKEFGPEKIIFDKMTAVRT